VSAAERWLRERVPDSPAPLLRTMLEALPPEGGEVEPSGVPGALAAGALHLYREVVRGSGGREDALPLLAADALLTHAFQAQAEISPDGLPSLVAQCGPDGRLGEVAP
jgi:hypothetical protein